MVNAMPRTARTPSGMSRVRARRDGRPTLIRGPVGPPPRSGIWKAKVRTSKFAVGPSDPRRHGPSMGHVIVDPHLCNLLTLYSVPDSGRERGKIVIMSNTPMAASPLTRAVLEIDEYASGLGWGQPARLFAPLEHAPARDQD